MEIKFFCMYAFSFIRHKIIIKVMLEYVNNLSQKRGVSRYAIVGMAISFLLHFCVVLIFSLFPGLLAGGYFHGFRGFFWGTDANDDDIERWRVVAILEPPDRMNMPSSEALRKALGLGDREEGEGAPPIELRFGPLDALEADKPLPQIPPKVEDPEIVIPYNRERPGIEDETKPDTGSSDESPEVEQPFEQGTGSDLLAAKPKSNADAA